MVTRVCRYPVTLRLQDSRQIFECLLILLRNRQHKWRWSRSYFNALCSYSVVWGRWNTTICCSDTSKPPIHPAVSTVTNVFLLPEYSKNFRLHWDFWGIVIWYIKFVRSCGSVFGMSLPSGRDISLQTACFTRKKNKKFNILH